MGKWVHEGFGGGAESGTRGRVRSSGEIGRAHLSVVFIGRDGSLRAVTSTARLPEDLAERVLGALGFSARPEPTLGSLQAVYDAWCRRVPFDNVRKLIHLHRNDPSPLPGIRAEDFFEAWLRHHAGGTCWATSNGLFTLLGTLGFEVERGIATMLVAPGIPPNHGSVRVRCESQVFLVDTSILTGAPLPLNDHGQAEIRHPAWGVRGEHRDGRWHIGWRPLHQPEGFECGYEHFGASHLEYANLYEGTRGWSPFNYQLTARTNRGDDVIGMTFGNAVTLRADGSVEVQPITDEERRHRLITDFGMSEELISQLPPDRPTPPPPGSKTAAEAAANERKAGN